MRFVVRKTRETELSCEIHASLRKSMHTTSAFTRNMPSSALMSLRKNDERTYSIKSKYLETINNSFHCLVTDEWVEIDRTVVHAWSSCFRDGTRRVAGPGEAELLRAQGIRSVYSFLSTDDVFAILSIPCQAWRGVRKSICLEADDQSFIVKPGARSNIRYLFQLLLQRHEEQLKHFHLSSKRIKSYSQSNSIANTTASQDSTQLTITSTDCEYYWYALRSG